MLRAENISKTYWDRDAGRMRTVLDGCSLSVGQGEAVGLMGISGCGKSTLARILLRLIPETAGRIFWEGEDLTGKRGRALFSFRRQVQLISQRPESFFDPLKKLGYSLEEPFRVFGLSPAESAIYDVLELVKLNPALLARYPHEVSGGEIQRLSIARALLLKPKLFILDEPTSMLDVSVQAQILHVLKEVREKENLAYLLISHDRDVIQWMCGRTLFMKEGRIIPQ